MSLELFMLIFVVGAALGLIYAMFKYVWGREIKGKKYYLIFLVLYLLALILAGANRLVLPNTFLTRAWGFIWNMAPSQTFPWWAISGIVLVILIILGFVAGCKLIAYFMSKEKEQITRGMLLRWLVGVLLTLLLWIILLVWRRSDCPYSSRSWLFGFFFMVLVIGARKLLSRRWKWLWRWKKRRTRGDKGMNMKRLKNTLLYIIQTPVALLAAIIFSTWLWLPDWVKKIWYRVWMRERRE